jgi:hypothetical protein
LILPDLALSFVTAVSSVVTNSESRDTPPSRGSFWQWHRSCSIANRGQKSDELSHKNISLEKAKLIVR